MLILLVAFAELQTEVSDFTSDLNLIGIPFWDYTNFAYKVLFPTDSACSSVLSDVRVCFIFTALFQIIQK